jgi:hypothetical protein
MGRSIEFPNGRPRFGIQADDAVIAGAKYDSIADDDRSRFDVTPG